MLELGKRLTGSDLKSPEAATIESFDFQWGRLPNARYLLSDADWRANVANYILDELGVTAEWIRGKTILDAGCGQGRWSYGFQKLGCHVFGFDSSENGVNYARHAIPNGQFAIADILDAERLNELYHFGQFEAILCWGVLHHTGNPAQALANLVPLLAPHGLLHVYVYGRKGRLLGLERMVVTRLPLEARVYVVKLTSRLTHSSAHGNFDALSPKIATEHTEGEVRRWFTDAGLSVLRVGVPNWRRGSTGIFITGSFE